jgi:Sulfotransferase family
MLSHVHKTIFVHIPKTGGEAVVSVFLEDLGKSWEQRSDLLVRQNSDPKRGPPALGHMFATEYLTYGYVTQDLFDAYFKFAIVRNPWARFVSAYKFTVERRPPPWQNLQFPDFVLGRFPSSARIARHLEPQWKFVCDGGGQSIVRNILRFEQLADSFSDLASRIFADRQKLRYTNVSQNRTDYRRYFTDRTASIVADRYRKDIELFGYSFD